MIPTLDDAALASLRNNASRLEAGGKGAKQKEAAALLPIIEAEQAQRLANKPVKPKAVRATAARKSPGPAGRVDRGLSAGGRQSAALILAATGSSVAASTGERPCS